VGGYFGGRLAVAGEEVTFIARGKHLQALRGEGLRVNSVDGDFAVHPVSATDRPADVGPVEAVLVAVKTWQLLEAAAAARPLVGAETVVLPLLNGVEAASRLSETLGREHVLGGLCRIIAEKVGPGHIRHHGAEPYVALGELDNRRSERAERLRSAFAGAGVRVEIPDDIHVAMWEKFLLIASVSGVGAVTRAPVGVLRSLPETRALITQAMREILVVARARGVDLAAETVDRALDFIDGLPPEGTASMQRDIVEGRPSELEAQNGAVVRLGREAGVETPVHAFLYSSLLPMERAARGEAP